MLKEWMACPTQAGSVHTQRVCLSVPACLNPIKTATFTNKDQRML